MKNNFGRLNLWGWLLCLMLFLGSCGDIAREIYPTGTLLVKMNWPNGKSDPDVKTFIITVLGEGTSPKVFTSEKATSTIRDLATGPKEIQVSAIDAAGIERYRGKSNVNIGKKSQSTVVVELRAIRPPTISSGPTANPTSVSIGQTSIISVSALDPDGDLLTYTWDTDGGAISGTGSKVTYTAPETVGTYSITVTVSDGEGSVSGSVNITVSEPSVTLSITKSGNGAITSDPAGIHCGETCSTSFAAGTSVILTATSTPGAVFSSWEGGCTGTVVTCTVTMDMAKSVKALFKGWGVATPIETDNAGDADSPQVAVDADGNAMAVWVQNSSIWANRFEAANMRWGTAELIEKSSEVPADSPQVAVDPEGNVIAVWKQFDGEGRKNSIFANRFVPGIGWGTAMRIDSNNTHAHSPQVAIGSSIAIAVWTQAEGAKNRTFANRFLGAGWGTAMPIDSNDTSGPAHSPQVAVGSEGTAMAVWVQDFSIWANRFKEDTGWGTPTKPIEENRAEPPYFPQVAVDSAGATTAVWVQDPSIRANRLEAAHTVWETAKRFEEDSTSRGLANSPQVAVDSAGFAIAIWKQSVEKQDSIWANRFVPGSGWEPAKLIGMGNPLAQYPQIAVDSKGAAMAVWVQDSGIWANRFVPGSGWETAVAIKTDNSGGAVAPQVAIDASGNAIVVWQQSYEKRYNIWANRFEVP